MAEVLRTVHRRDGQARLVDPGRCERGDFRYRGVPVFVARATSLQADIGRATGFLPQILGIYRAPDGFAFVEATPGHLYPSPSRRLYFEAAREHLVEILDLCKADEATRAHWLAGDTSPAAVSAPRRAVLSVAGMATAAAYELRKAGGKVSVSAVARKAGVDRSNLHKGHPEVIKIIKTLAAPDRHVPRGWKDRHGRVEAYHEE
jgi:hypothetical protein